MFELNYHLIRTIIDSELTKLKPSPFLTRAADILLDMVVKKQDEFVGFLTLQCYDDILEREARKRAESK